MEEIRPEGITNPPIDELLELADSKYALVIYGAKRARQINAYYSQLDEGLLEHVGPLVETHVEEKPLSVALREMSQGVLRCEPLTEAQVAAEAAAAAAPAPAPGAPFDTPPPTEFTDLTQN